MSATTDRSRHDTRDALLLWHAQEARGLLENLPDLFRIFFQPQLERHGAEAFERRYSAYLEEMREASDHFNRLYALLAERE
jgi:hypothetical protein